ncbi:MAG: hypothetical protein D4Q77_02000 [Methanothrix sp.]|nr:MAG: hypothetical protein D4Q77_02000 [Methanothrix sp.]
MNTAVIFTVMSSNRRSFRHTISEDETTEMPNLFIKHQAGLTMFEPNEESTVLEIVCDFLDVMPDDMMKIGDITKKVFFDPCVENKEVALERLKGALKEMSNEQAVIAGMFISGLLRCNLTRQYMQATAQAEGDQDTE